MQVDELSEADQGRFGENFSNLKNAFSLNAFLKGKKKVSQTEPLQPSVLAD
jgi:hypothetical protein